MEQQKKRDYEIYWPHVILVGAIALVLVLIGVVIGVNIGKSKKYKPVPVTGQGYTWTLQPGAEAQMIYTNFWQFAKASYVLVGDIPNCEFYKIVKEVPRNDFQTDNFYMEDGDNTIIAYPMPEIGDDYEEIFEQIIRINNLESDVYRPVHQMIIDELDQAEWVHVIGQNGNQTDMKVSMHVLERPETETNFENCLADVNIPLGEVFTSPKLTGTHGVLNVSEVYLNDLKYVDLKLTFEDGKIKTYTCKNFDREEDNVKFVKDNLLGGRDTLPIGEFAIGTNTTAYVLANKYNMVYKLPILIVEKMGPHFAVGDTCYSWSEENILHNPDGKEIVAKDNECSILRKTDISKAYFNCHTDITIPYDEIGGIYSVHADGTKVAIIENGRFVLPGTEMLNEPFKEAK